MLTMNHREWAKILKEYAKADHHKVTAQILNTLIPYVLLLLLIFSLAKLGKSPLLILPIVVVAAGFMVRVFIFFHDCTHGSYVATSRGNDLLGNIFGFFVFTPYIQWKIEHSIHHSTVGNLNERGVGDIWTMTVSEYEASSRPKRFIYRLFRHPAFLFTIAPVFKFMVLNRFPKVRKGKKEVINYLWHDLAFFTYMTLLVLGFGWWAVLYQVLVSGIAASAGLWLFYVQHQFEEVYWADADHWNLVEAALKGSTYYKLPKVLEWFTGYIGYHHIHHLNARIPNYHLKASYRNIRELQNIKTVTLFESFKLGALALYDEQKERLMTFSQYTRQKRTMA